MGLLLLKGEIKIATVKFMAPWWHILKPLFGKNSITPLAALNFSIKQSETIALFKFLNKLNRRLFFDS